MDNFNKTNSRIISKTIIVFLLIMTMFSSLPSNVSPVVSDVEAVENDINGLAIKAIINNYEAYQSGTKVDAGWGNFSAYDAYILIKAGVDIDTWMYEGKSFNERVIELIDATIANIKNEGTLIQSPAKRIVQDYLAAKSLGYKLKATQLLNILENRQKKDGSFDSNVYSDFPALDMLARVNVLTTSSIDVDSLVTYILNNQDTSGGWPKHSEGSYVDGDGVTQIYEVNSDLMSTVEAVRVLKSVENDTAITPLSIQTAILKGKTWLEDKQKSDGSYKAGWDDEVTDTSEIIYTIKVLEEDSSKWNSTEGKSPVDYMKDNALVDESFGNVPSTTWALDAYLQLGAIIEEDEVLKLDVISNNVEIYEGDIKQLEVEAYKLDNTTIDVSNLASWTSEDLSILSVDDQGLVTAVASGTTNITVTYLGCSKNITVAIKKNSDLNTVKKINAYVAVIGKKGELLYGPISANILEDDSYGFTAAGALDATDVSWGFSTKYDGQIVEIDKLRNKGQSGWMYAINGITPLDLPLDKTVKDGDKILFWYSTSVMEGVPDWPNSNHKVDVTFDDVNDDIAWAKYEIETLAGKGIINGTGNGFKPQRTITRAEFVKLIVSALELEIEKSTGNIFTDINTRDWFADVVECGYNQNIITGDPDGKFRPNDAISRNEIAVILSRLQENLEDIEEYDLSFEDENNVPTWARKGVEFVSKQKIMNGYNDNTFKGSKALSRAEAAVVIYRYLNWSL